MHFPYESLIGLFELANTKKHQWKKSVFRMKNSVARSAHRVASLSCYHEVSSSKCKFKFTQNLWKPSCDLKVTSIYTHTHCFTDSVGVTMTRSDVTGICYIPVFKFRRGLFDEGPTCYNRIVTYWNCRLRNSTEDVLLGIYLFESLSCNAVRLL